MTELCTAADDEDEDEDGDESSNDDVLVPPYPQSLSPQNIPK